MPDTIHHKVLIIGSGPAGYTAAVYAARAMLEPGIVAGLQPGGQLMITTDVENYPGFPEVLGPDLMEKFKEHALKFGTKFYEDMIVDVDFTNRPFRMTGDAGTLYDSIQRLFALPDQTRVFLCHDYKAPGRDIFVWETTVAAQKANNIHLNASISRDDFIAMRTARDKTLDMPRLILPSIQVNMRAGEMPPPDNNGQVYLKIPLNAV